MPYYYFHCVPRNGSTPANVHAEFTLDNAQIAFVALALSGAAVLVKSRICELIK